MISPCSLSNDSSLTKCLIQSSNSPLKCFHRFFHRPEWADGLDIWTTTENVQKYDSNRKNLDFHDDIGLYLPRAEKCLNQSLPIKNEETSTKSSNTNTLLFSRVIQRVKKEKENSTKISSPDERLSTSDDTQSSNTLQLCECNRIVSKKLRFPLRHVLSKNSQQQIRTKHIERPITNEMNKENLKYLLKEQLNNLFYRETISNHEKRTVIKIPSVQIKHQNLFIPPKIIPATDPNVIMERYSKLQQILMSTPPCQATITSKFVDSNQSPLAFQDIANKSLTITPLDFSSSKTLQNTSLEKITQQDHQSLISRPSTQPTTFQSSMQPSDQQRQTLLKSTVQDGFISSSGHFTTANRSFTDEQNQTMRKFHRHLRSSSNYQLQRSKTFDLLPSLVSGKRLHISIANQRNS